MFCPCSREAEVTLCENVRHKICTLFKKIPINIFKRVISTTFKLDEEQNERMITPDTHQISDDHPFKCGKLKRAVHYGCFLQGGNAMKEQRQKVKIVRNIYMSQLRQVY